MEEINKTDKDFALHLIPIGCLILEWLTNCQIFLSHHYKIVILFMILIPHLAITVLIELFTDQKLYLLDISPVEYIHIPIYPLVAILISYPLFFAMELITTMKLKNQGYPCDKILYEIKEFNERASKRDS